MGIDTMHLPVAVDQYNLVKYDQQTNRIEDIMSLTIEPGWTIEPGCTLGLTPPGYPLGSAFFNGTNQYLTTTLPNTPGTGNYTVEWWSYVTDWANPTNLNFFDTRTSTGDANGFSVNVVGTELRYRVSGTLGIATSRGGMSLNNWYHMAAVRSVSTNTLYINGSSTITVTDGGDLSNSALAIGKSFDGAYFSGYISNFRYVQGVTVYTGTFTPPTQPLRATQSAGANISAITGVQTQILLNTTNDVNNLVNTSIYSVTMTNHGTSPGVSASASTPFTP